MTGIVGSRCDWIYVKDFRTFQHSQDNRFLSEAVTFPSESWGQTRLSTCKVVISLNMKQIYLHMK